jgi:hypothetical protein
MCNCLSLQPDLKQTPRKRGDEEGRKEDKESNKSNKFFADGEYIRE